MISLNDFLDFVLLWVKKRTQVHLGELVIFPAMVRHCLCCHGSQSYAWETDGLCQACSQQQVCALCKVDFVPGAESVGVFCPVCWQGLERTWRETFEGEDPVAAESKVKGMVRSARPNLTSCRHLG